MLRHVDTYRETIKKIKEVIAIKVKILLIYREEGMVYVGVRSIPTAPHNTHPTTHTQPLGLRGGGRGGPTYGTMVHLPCLCKLLLWGTGSCNLSSHSFLVFLRASQTLKP